VTYLNPKQVIVEFLRANLTDPRGRVSSRSESFAAIASQTTFSLTPTNGRKLSCITNVTVNGAAKTKWRDYRIDFQGQQVVFFTGLSLSDAVLISYREGSTDWIYDDKPAVKIGPLSFPRISITQVPLPGERLGNFESPVEAAFILQHDVYAKEHNKDGDNIFTIDGKKYEGEALAEKLTWDILQAFDDSEDDLYPVLYNMIPLTSVPRDMPFDENYQAHRKQVEIQMKGLNMSEV